MDSGLRASTSRANNWNIGTMAAKDPAKLPVDDLTEKQARPSTRGSHAEIAAHDRRYYQDDAPTRFRRRL